MKFYLTHIFIFISALSFGQQKEFEKAKELFTKRKFKQTVKWLDKSISKNPSVPFVYELRGAANFELLNFEEAVSDFKKVVSFEPDNVMALFHVGLSFDHLKNYSQACEFYSTALEKGLEDKGINLQMAESMSTTFYFCSDLEKAEKYLKLALRMGSTDSAIPNDLAWVYTQTGKYKEAIELFKQAYDLAPTQYQNVNNLGYAYYLDGQLEKAEEYILEAKNLNPDNSFVYRNLGLIRMKQENKDEACEYLQKAIDLKILEEWGEFYVEDLLNYCNKE